MTNNIQNKKTNLTERRLFSCFLAVYPVLCVYKGVSSFTIGDLILIGWVIYALRYPIYIDDRTIAIGAFSLYAGALLILNIVFSSITSSFNTMALIFRFVKFVFYMASVVICSRRFLDFNIFRKAISWVSVVSVVVVVLQYFSYYVLDSVLLGFIPGLPVYLSEYTEIDYQTFYSYQFRPSSIFVEPASLSQFLAAALVCVLFTEEKGVDIKKIFLAGIIAAGILLSTSAQGVFYLGVILCIYIYCGMKKKKNAIILVAVSVCLLFILYRNTSYVRNAVDRLLYNDAALDARLGAFEHCFALDWLPMLVGYGYGTTYNGEYFSGMAYIWYGCGLIGLILVVGIFRVFYRRAAKIGKIICLLFAIMFISTGLFYNYMLFWYFSMMMLRAKKTESCSCIEYEHNYRTLRANI